MKNNQPDNNHNMIYDTIIIGGGPAAYTAAIYAARGGATTLVCAGNNPGGQLMITTDVENYPGFSHPILGPELMKAMREQTINVGARVVDQYVRKVNFDKKAMHYIEIDDDISYISKTTIIATGASAKWLGLESEKKFIGYGVSGCATCDGCFFRNKVVAVVGGGNTAAEEALYLAKYVSKIYLIHRRDEMRCENILFERLKNEKKIEFVWNSVIEEVLGQDKTEDSFAYVTGAKIRNVKDDTSEILNLDGIFIAIGHKPNTDIISGILPLDHDGYAIKKSPSSSHTIIDGVFLAGDVEDKVYRQAVTAAAGGCIAALDAIRYLGELS